MEKERIAIYPGSFDPISNGHIDIIRRASLMFDKVYVLVSFNPNKKYTFTTPERVNMIKDSVKDFPNVVIEASNSLLLNYAKSKNASVIVRGVRNINDYQNEITRFQFNRSIDPSIDTIILFPSTNNLFLSSSSIKELVEFGADISPYVPTELAGFISQRIKDSLK